MKTKVAVSLDSRLLAAIDRQVKKHAFASRSAAIEAAIRGYAKQTSEEAYNRLIDQLDPAEEQAWAELRFSGDVF